MNNIRAVAFDYGGVLAAFISKESVAKMAEFAKVDYPSFNTSMWKFRNELDSGEYNNTQYWTAVLDECNSPIEKEAHIDTLVEMDLDGFSMMNKNMLSWAKELKLSGITTLIISNMATSTYEALMVKHEWMNYFDEVVISGIIHINKPDSRIFNLAVERAQVHAHEMLFIDDVAHNVEGAKKAGLQALHFTTTTNLAKDVETQFSNLPLKGLLS